jgi:DHA1 family bicyclomycin/chloramphenicol resistance-like MFS transporter
MLGFTAGQLIYGALSDCYGRKPFLLAGLVIFLAATVACAMAVDIEQLILFRVIQGVGAAGAVVLARVMLLDTRHGERAARDMAIVSSIAMMSPILSPILSGYVVLVGWQLIFWLLAVLAIALLGYSAFALPETNPRGGERSVPLPRALAGYVLVLRDPVAIGYLLLSGFPIIGVVTFITAAPFLFQNIYHLSLQQFSYCLAFVMAGPAIGATISARMVYSRGTAGMVNIGVTVVTLAGTLLAIASWMNAHMVFILVFAFAYTIGVSIALPNVVITLIGRFHKNSGAAAAMLGLSQFLWSGIAIVLFAGIEQSTALPMALFIMGAGLASATVWVFFLGRRLQ